MHLIWHMRESLIFAYVAQSHEERELVECWAHPLSPHVIVPHGANMRGTLICNMRCIFLYIYISIPEQNFYQNAGRTKGGKDKIVDSATIYNTYLLVDLIA